MELRSLRERLKMRVAAELDLTRDVEDAEIARMIDRCILEETKDQYVPLKEKVGLRVELFNSLRRLDVLTELLEDDHGQWTVGYFCRAGWCDPAL